MQSIISIKMCKYTLFSYAKIYRRFQDNIYSIAQLLCIDTVLAPIKVCLSLLSVTFLEKYYYNTLSYIPGQIYE